MNRRIVASVVLAVAMVSASALTGALTPTVRLAEQQGKFQLDTMIPAAFGEWQVDASIVPLQADPEQQELLEKIYDQTLSRTYVDRDGQRVMLSIAYGGDQSRALQIHLPEVCYVAQGFDMLDSRHETLDTGHGIVPVKRLVARQNARNEPITYWITVGDKAIKSGIEQKMQRFAYGLSGKIPDGMLVRVSTIGPNPAAAYQVQDRFIKDLLGVVTGRDRIRLIGAASTDRTAAR